MDGVDQDAWTNWLLTTGEQTVLGIQDIQGYVVAEAGITVGNGFINGVNMTRLLSDAVRTDMPANLGHVSFGKYELGAVISRYRVLMAAFTEGGLRSYYPVYLGGLLSGLNISNALLLEPQPGLFEQTVLAPCSIGYLVVDGVFNPAGLVAGEKLLDLCDFANLNPLSTPENLYVVGEYHTMEKSASFNHR